MIEPIKASMVFPHAMLIIAAGEIADKELMKNEPKKTAGQKRRPLRNKMAIATPVAGHTGEAISLIVAM